VTVLAGDGLLAFFFFVASGDASLASDGEEPLFAAVSGGGVAGSSLPR
jgi:hypothetical protein